VADGEWVENDPLGLVSSSREGGGSPEIGKLW